MANNIYIDDSTETTDEALQELINQYNALGDYNAKTSDQIKAQAEGEYTAYYDQLKRTAQQANETQDLALQQQKNALQATYDKQRKQTAEEYANTYSQADRQMLSRGMQRSSYGAATLANIGNKAAEAQNEIGTAQTAAENNIEQQRQQLASQLATTLSGYDADKAANVLSRMQQLEDTEYERGVENRNTRNSLAAQIYEYMANRKAQDAAQAQWQAEFDENVRQFNIQLAENQRQFDEQMAAAKGSGSSSSYSGNTNPGNTDTGNKDAGTTLPTTQEELAALYKTLFGSDLDAIDDKYKTKISSLEEQMKNYRDKANYYSFNATTDVYNKVNGQNFDDAAQPTITPATSTTSAKKTTGNAKTMYTYK